MVYVQEIFGSKDDTGRLADLLIFSGFRSIQQSKNPAFAYDGVCVDVIPNIKNSVNGEIEKSFGVKLNHPLHTYSNNHPLFIFLNSLNSPRTYGSDILAKKPIEHISFTSSGGGFSNQKLNVYTNPIYKPINKQQKKSSFLMCLLTDLFNFNLFFDRFREEIRSFSVDAETYEYQREPILQRPSSNGWKKGPVYTMEDYMEKGRNAGFVDLNLELEEIVEEVPETPIRIVAPRRVKKKLLTETRAGTEIYNGLSEGTYAPNEMRRFFTETLDAKLVVGGSWKNGARKTPLDIYEVNTENGTAKFTYRAEDYARSKKSLLEGTGNGDVIKEVTEKLGEVTNRTERTDGIIQFPYNYDKSLEKEKNIVRRKRPKLEDQISSETEIYRDSSEGVYTPDKIRNFFTETLGAKLVVDGSWINGARKTPLQIYEMQTEKGTATFTYKAEDYARSKKSLLEGTGNEDIILEVANLLDKENDIQLEKPIPLEDYAEEVEEEKVAELVAV